MADTSTTTNADKATTPDSTTMTNSTTTLSSTTTPPPQPSLTTLPLELLFHLASYLDYPSFLHLQSTSRALRAALHGADAFLPAEKIAFYHHAERAFAQHAARLVCFTCFRFLPPDAFADRMRRGPRGKFGADLRRQRERVCWDCALRTRRYAHLVPVYRGGTKWYPCYECGVARVKDERCFRTSGDGCRGPRGGVKGVEDVESGLARTGAAGMRVLGDEALVARVCGLLGYEDLLRLRRTCRFLWRVVQPVAMCRDVYSMWSFVRARAEACKRRHTWWVRACFGCFRMRPEGHFSVKQRYLNAVGAWRRRCWECLRRLYHPTLPDHDARARFDRQVMCHVCRSMRFRDEPCRGCVVRQVDVEKWARIKKAKIAAGHLDYWDACDGLELLFGAAASGEAEDDEGGGLLGGLFDDDDAPSQEGDNPARSSVDESIPEPRADVL